MIFSGCQFRHTPRAYKVIFIDYSVIVLHITFLSIVSVREIILLFSDACSKMKFIVSVVLNV